MTYYEGWYDGDVERIDRALHPELVKRTVRLDGPALGIVSKDRMVALTAAGEGAQDAGDRTIDVTVLDVHDRIATVVYREYLHLVRGPDGGWRIAHALWQPADPG